MSEQERALTRAAVAWIEATDELNAVYKELEDEGLSLDLTDDGDASYHYCAVNKPWQRVNAAHADLVAKTRRWIRDHRQTAAIDRLAVEGEALGL